MTCPNNQFEQLIKGYVKPFFNERNFKKQSLNFYYETNDLYYLVNFQKSQGNSNDCVQFYINLGIYSSKMNKTIGKFDTPKPKITDCHYCARIEQLTEKTYQHYTLDVNTRTEDIAVCVIRDLEIAVEQLLSIETTDDLIVSNTILDYQVLARYLLLTDRQKHFEALYKQLFESFGTERRWSIIKNNLDKIVIDTKS